MAKDPFASIKIRDFKFFVSARLFMTIALEMQMVLVNLQVYEYTKDPFWLGMINLTQVIPLLLTALFAGHIADIIERKKIMMNTTLVLCVSIALLEAFTLDSNSFLNRYGIFPIFIVVFFSGIAKAFISPAFTGFLAQIVPREQYTNASTWYSSAWQAGAVTGPAIGSVLFGLIGVKYAYAINLALMVLSFILLIFIPARPLAPRERKESIWQSLGQGINFVFKTQEILGCLSLDLFAVLFGGAVTLFPIFSDQVLKLGPIGFGFLRAAPSVGAILMGLIMIYYPPMKNAGKKMLFSVAAFGICTILFAFSKNPILSISLLVLSGAFDSVSVVVRSTIVQLMTPDEMRGRVSSVNSIFIASSNEIGGFESGVAAKLMGLIPSVVFGGSVTMLVTGFTALKSKKLRALQLDTKV